MKIGLLMLTFLFALFTSCNKSTENPSVQSLLQNRWTLLSEVYSYPNTIYGPNVYNGMSSDYYQFSLNDTFILSQAGSPSAPGYPIQAKRKYSLLDNNHIFLYGNSGVQPDTLTIQKITSDSLVLTSPLYFTYVDTSRNYVNDTGVITSRLFR